MVGEVYSGLQSAGAPFWGAVQRRGPRADDLEMGRLLVFIAIAAGAYYLLNWVDASGGLHIQGRDVVVETEDFEVHFSRGSGFSEAFMVFGGLNDPTRNMVGHATLSTLAMRHAELIHQRYPDFHMCKSPGAAQAKRYIETMSLIGTTRSARKTVREAVDLHAERIRSGGERTCVSLTGAALSFDSISLKPDGQDVTSQFGPALNRTAYYLAEQAELVDCASLLR